MDSGKQSACTQEVYTFIRDVVEQAEKSPEGESVVIEAISRLHRNTTPAEKATVLQRNQQINLLQSYLKLRAKQSVVKAAQAQVYNADVEYTYSKPTCTLAHSH